MSKRGAENDHMLGKCAGSLWELGTREASKNRAKRHMSLIPRLAEEHWKLRDNSCDMYPDCHGWVERYLASSCLALPRLAPWFRLGTILPLVFPTRATGCCEPRSRVIINRFLSFSSLGV